MRAWLAILLLGTVSLFSYAQTTGSATDPKPWIPKALEPWQSWVLHQHPDADCPFLNDAKDRVCAWPQGLVLQLDDSGGQFQLTVTAASDAWLTLPGSTAHWPKDVRLHLNEPTATAGPAVAVVSSDGRPRVWLKKGTQTLSGHFSWQELPEHLQLPETVARVELSLNGTAVVPPDRNKDGKLWLKRPLPEAERQPEHDRLSVQVFRKIYDGQPQVVTTELQLQISGRAREVTLGPIYPEGFTPRDLTSALPARVGPQGQVTIRVKPGRYQLRLDAHSLQPHNTFAFAAEARQGPWPDQEVWAFAAEPQLRSVQVTGAAVIDASQTNLPAAWRSLPTYLLETGDTLTLNEQFRGDPNPASNVLKLSKSVWLDFDGEQMTARDRITGQLTSGTRLETQPPYDLGRVSADGQGLLITTLAGAQSAGVELRRRQLDLEAVSRLPRQAQMPVSGWQQTFTEVDTRLQLPPGWSALHISGADRTSGTWLSRWNLWDIFLVLVISVALFRVASLPVGLLTLATLLLVFHRASAPVLPWLNFAACFALVPFARGRFKTWLNGYLAVSIGATLLLCLPFWVQESRSAIYPQLARATTAAFSPADLSDTVAPALMQTSDALLEKAAPAAARQSLRAPPVYHLEYSPDQRIQVGPGQPEWQWRELHAHWSGPVLEHETFSVHLVGPWLNRLGHLLSVLLVAALLAAMILRFRATGAGITLRSFKGGGAALVVLALLATEQKTYADPVIDQELLTRLEERLLAPPHCLPECTAIEQLQVVAQDPSLQLSMIVHNQQALGVPLPGAFDSWWPQSILLDGEPVAPLHARAGKLYVYLQPGRHSLSLSGSLRDLRSFELDFHQALHNVEVRADGWTVSGLPSRQQSSRLLSFARIPPSAGEPAAEDREDRLTPAPVEGFVSVSRELRLGLEWTTHTKITRIAPASGALQIALPLLPGEAPVSGERNPDGTMDLRLGPDDKTLEFSALLPITDSLTLTAAEQARWTEVWRVVAGPMWHVAYLGPPSLAAQSAYVEPSWQPRPGDTLQLTISRPEPVAGRDFAIDQLNLDHQPGDKVRQSELNMSIRASFASRMTLPLPDGAKLTRVAVNGVDTPIAQNEHRLDLPVTPGTQSVTVAWQTPGGVETVTRMPRMALGTEASNISLSLRLPPDRWLLATGGPALGPAILFWGVLATVLLLAAGLSRTQLTPLKTWEWLVLALGVATVHLGVLALAAGWFIALTLRGRVMKPPLKSTFNALQVLLIVFSVVTLVALAASIPSSLLSRPDMYVTGNGSYAHALNWYYDRSTSDLPEAWAFSLPLGAYRLLMLVWSLWLAFALMRWLKWGWQQLHTGAFWVQPPPPPSRISAPDASRNNAEQTQKDA